MRITESQLRKIIRDVIKENDETLNEGFLRHGILPALLIMSGLSHIGKAMDKYSLNRDRATVARALENVDFEQIIADMEKQGLPLSAEGVRKYAKGKGVKIDNAALFDALADATIVRHLNPLPSENPTSYDGSEGPMSMPESRTRRRRRA